MLVETNGVHVAGLLATMGQTPTASVAYLHAANRAFIASGIDDFQNVFVVFVATHGEFDAIGGNSSFFINATPHRRSGTRGYFLRDIGDILLQSTVIVAFRHFLKNMVFEFLHLGIEFQHGHT